jgi:hypothetical protein
MVPIRPHREFWTAGSEAQASQLRVSQSTLATAHNDQHSWLMLLCTDSQGFTLTPARRTAFVCAALVSMKVHWTTLSIPDTIGTTSACQWDGTQVKTQQVWRQLTSPAIS